MRILHTSDWHLGHTLHNISRVAEHQCFLDWLLVLLRLERIDALIITGDIFDSCNPPISATRAWYRFLAAAIKQGHEFFRIIVIGGNHDSAGRLDAPVPLLREMGVRIIGGIPRKQDREMDVAAMCAPLHNSDGKTEAWCAAMPFIRVADLPLTAVEEGRDPLVEAIRGLYHELLDHAVSLAEPGQAVIATGHCYMSGAVLSEFSERKVLSGNQHALPVDIFRESLAYVALGHLHKPQTVGNRNWIRYAGSPLPLSFAELDYRHQVNLVELSDGRTTNIREIAVPRSVEMIRLPRRPIEEVLDMIANLEPLKPGMETWQRPYLEVRVALSEPVPGLRIKLETALQGKAARLLKTTVEYSGRDRSLADHYPEHDLEDMRVEDVFKNCYRQRHDAEPSEELLSLFHELVEETQRAEA